MEKGMGLKNCLRALSSFIYLPLQAGKKKIFCISMQRNGTTSVGDFLVEHGYRVARYGDSRKNNWTYKWHTGNYESIFKSVVFRSFQAYEDDPWWMPDFYRVLNQRFPGARFILFHRDPDKWFDSMKSHSQGRTLGNTHRHCRIYRRLSEFYDRIDNDESFCPTKNEIENLLELNESHRNHYKRVYKEYNREAIEYFKSYAPSRFFVTRLEDKEKWIKLGIFLGIKVNSEYDIHSNKSKRYFLK